MGIFVLQVAVPEGLSPKSSGVVSRQLSCGQQNYQNSISASFWGLGGPKKLSLEMPPCKSPRPAECAKAIFNWIIHHRLPPGWGPTSDCPGSHAKRVMPSSKLWGLSILHPAASSLANPCGVYSKNQARPGLVDTLIRLPKLGPGSHA